jgi:thymidylate synthase
MVNAWNVGELDQMVLPPCHYGFQVYTRELTGEERWDLLKERVGGHKFQLMVDDIVPFGGGLSEELQSYNIPKRAISLMWNQRSVDTFLGLPFNIASYGLLLEIIAKSVNMVSDELIGNLGDVHLYKNHIEQAKEQIDREPFKLPKLNINTEFWPTEGGECGIGLIDAKSVFEGFTNEHFCKCLLEDDIQLYDYQSYPTIKAPLSN